MKINNKIMIRLSVKLFIFILAVIILFIQLNGVEGTSYKEKFLEEDDYHDYGLIGFYTDNWTISLDH